MAAKVIWSGKIGETNARVVYQDSPEAVVIESMAVDALGNPAWGQHPTNAGIAQEILLEVIKSIGKA